MPPAGTNVAACQATGEPLRTVREARGLTDDAEGVRAEGEHHVTQGDELDEQHADEQRQGPHRPGGLELEAEQPRAGVAHAAHRQQPEQLRRHQDAGHALVERLSPRRGWLQARSAVGLDTLPAVSRGTRSCSRCRPPSWPTRRRACPR